MPIKNSQDNILSVTKLTSKNAREITNKLEVYKRTHESRGFKIIDFHGENEFYIQYITYYLCPPMVNIYAKYEHVGFIKEATSTVKYIIRLMCHDVPYKKYTKLVTKSLVEGAVELLNYIPSNDSVSETIIPSIEVKVKIDIGLKSIGLGTYIIVYVRTTNTMKRRSIPEISLKA